MAYNSVRERDPLIDKETQRALERRLTEFLGVLMIACAALFSLIIFTYSPTDPGPYLPRIYQSKTCSVAQVLQLRLL